MQLTSLSKNDKFLHFEFLALMDGEKVYLGVKQWVERKTEGERGVFLFVRKKRAEWKGVTKTIQRKGGLYRNAFTYPAMVSTLSRAITLQVATVHFKAYCRLWQLSLVLWIDSYLYLCNWILGFLWLFTMGETLAKSSLHCWMSQINYIHIQGWVKQ